MIAEADDPVSGLRLGTNMTAVLIKGVLGQGLLPASIRHAVPRKEIEAGARGA
jgi:hypothetical protein